MKNRLLLLIAASIFINSPLQAMRRVNNAWHQKQHTTYYKNDNFYQNNHYTYQKFSNNPFFAQNKSNFHSNTRFGMAIKKGFSGLSSLAALGLGLLIYGLYDENSNEEESKNTILSKIDKEDESVIDDVIYAIKHDIDVSWLKENWSRLIDLKIIFIKFFEKKQNSDRLVSMLENIVTFHELDIMDAIPESDALDQAIKKHFSELISIDACYSSYEDFVNVANKLSDNALDQCIAENLPLIISHKHKEHILNYAVPALSKNTLDVLINNHVIDPDNTAVALRILAHQPCYEKVFEAMVGKKNTQENDFFTSFFLRKKNECAGGNDLDKTQSEYHFDRLHDINSHYTTERPLDYYTRSERAEKYSSMAQTIKDYTSDSSLKTILNTYNSKARELEQQGYTTFVHGQPLRYEFMTSLYTQLRKIHTKKLTQDFTFVRAYDPRGVNKIQEKNLHELALQQGLGDHVDRSKRVLFLNYSFFANTQYGASSSAGYIANNSSHLDVKIDYDEMFRWFNMESAWIKYHSEIVALQEEHQNLNNKYGNCLLVAIPKDTIDQSVYVARPGGYKKDIKPSQALERLKSEKASFADIDKIEFCLPMTDSAHGGLNPQSGIKFFNINAIPEREWDEYSKRRDTLFAKMEKEMERRSKSI